MADFEDDIEFLAPDGSDPVDYSKNTLLKIGQGQEKGLIDAAIYLEDQIRKRTAQGLSFDGPSFTPYSEEYAIRKVKAGHAQGDISDVPNLSYTGTMMGSMSTRLNGEKSFEIGFFGVERQAAKARIHNEGAYFAIVNHGDRRIKEKFHPVTHRDVKRFAYTPARPFLGFTDQDLDTAAQIVALGSIESIPGLSGDDNQSFTADFNPFGFTPEELDLDTGYSYAPTASRGKKTGRRRSSF